MIPHTGLGSLGSLDLAEGDLALLAICIFSHIAHHTVISHILLQSFPLRCKYLLDWGFVQNDLLVILHDLNIDWGLAYDGRGLGALRVEHLPLLLQVVVGEVTTPRVWLSKHRVTVVKYQLKRNERKW